MPTYTIKNVKTEEEWDVRCSWDDLQEMFKENPDWQTVIKPVGLVSQSKGTLTQAGDGWKDVLKSIKKESGKANTINV